MTPDANYDDTHGARPTRWRRRAAVTADRRGTSTARRHVAVAAVAVIVAAGAIAGCGVPTGDQTFDAIDDDDVPFRLAESSTTAATTSTTTTIPATTSPVPTQSTLPPIPTTTTATEPVEVYFLRRDAMVPAEFQVRSPVRRADLTILLESAPADDGPLRSTTEIERGLIASTTVDGGVATINLDEEIFDDIPTFRQDEAIAQMVLTFTSNLRGVGQVVFTYGGEPLAIPGTRAGVTTFDPVSFDDYDGWLTDGTAFEGSTTTPSTETTLVPQPTVSTAVPETTTGS